MGPVSFPDPWTQEQQFSTRPCRSFRSTDFAGRRATWSDAQQLTFDDALVEFLDVSPDGTRLAVSSDRSGNQDLWTLPTLGGEMQPLTDHPTPDWDPSWSPDGK